MKQAKSPLQLSRSKRRLFALITIVTPVLFLMLLEVILRLLDYGHDLSLFARETIGGKQYLVMNPGVKGRYFSEVEFSPNTSPDYFQMPKADSTFRIFCLGGSTTAGFPYSFVGSFSTYMRDRLRVMFPNRNIEVINLGMTATNSYTVLDIAKELVDYQPDLFVVYDGHNEFYGALGIASRESVPGSRWITKAHLQLVHIRSFQLLRNMFTSVARMFAKTANSAPSGTMMERLARGQYVRYGSDTYMKALDNFRSNISELADLCRRHRIHLFLGGQVSNLRDQQPFVSTDNETPKSHELENTLTQGRDLFHAGEFSLALNSFQQVLQIDSLRADAQYLSARCLDTLGRKAEALSAYVKARDYDMLRFRMSNDFNNVLREESDGKYISFVDIERKFRANSHDELIGSTLMLDHLHPNARGYYLMAKQYVRMMHLRHLIVDSDDIWNSRDNVDEEAMFAARPVTELDDRCAQRRIELLTAGWPFRPQQTSAPNIDPTDTLGIIAEQMVQGYVTWEQGHVTAAEHYARRHDLANLEREYKALINQLPFNVSAYLFLAQVYLQQNKNGDAAYILEQSLKMEKTLFAYRVLGTLALDPPVAINFFENAVALSTPGSEKAESMYLLSQAHLRGGNAKKATELLKQILEFSPDFPPARQLLSQLSSSNR